MKYSEAIRLSNFKFPENLIRCRILSNYESDQIQIFLKAVGSLVHCEYEISSSGYQNLMNDIYTLEKNGNLDFLVVIIHLEDVFPELSYRTVSEWNHTIIYSVLSQADERIDKFINLLFDNLARLNKRILLIPPFLDIPPLIDCNNNLYTGLHNLMIQLTYFMTRKAREVTLIDMLYPQRLLTSYQEEEIRDDKLLFIGGCPLSSLSSYKIAEFINAWHTKIFEQKKLLITDLDQTLWKGIIGEDGPFMVQSLPSGESYHHHVYQSFLKLLSSQGIILAVCSKNNPEDVFDFINDEVMVSGAGLRLKASDFAIISCDWTPKSTQIAEICKQLNILPSSVVFIDDNPLEINEVQLSIPEITCIPFPGPQDIHSFLSRVRKMFSTQEVTIEDSRRLELYKIKKNYDVQSSTFENHNDLLKSLKMKVRFAVVTIGDEERSFQLYNKTNQFNLTGRRLSKEEWKEYLNRNLCFCISAKLSDQFGDHGIVFVALIRIDGNTAFIENLVLSCRVFNRGIETSFLDWLTRRFTVIKHIRGFYKSTGKNKACSEYYLQHGFTVTSNNELEIYYSNSNLKFVTHYLEFVK